MATCDKEECKTRGTCNDWEVRDWNTNGKGGSCVFPHVADEWGGYEQCDKNPAFEAFKCSDLSSGQAEWGGNLGCKWVNSKFKCTGGNWNHSTFKEMPVDCTSASKACGENGGKWYDPATDSESCTGHGAGCMSGWDYNGMTEDTCTDCGEEWTPYFNWNPARFQAGMLSPLSWKKRKWGPVRKWAKTVIMPVFEKKMGTAVAKVIGRKLVSATVQKYNPILEIMGSVGCACTPGLSERTRPTADYNEGVTKGFGTVSTCFNVSTVLFGEAKVFIGVNTRIGVPGMTLNASFTKPFVKTDNETGKEVVVDNADVTFEKVSVGGMSLPPDEGQQISEEDARQGDKANSGDKGTGTSTDTQGLLASKAAAITSFAANLLSSGIAAPAVPQLRFEKKLVWSDRYPGYDRYQKHNPYGYSAQEVIRAVIVDDGATSAVSGTGLHGEAKLLAEDDSKEAAMVVSAKSTADQWAVVRDECNLFGEFRPHTPCVLPAPFLILLFPYS
jgi:hypothetical protein